MWQIIQKAVRDLKLLQTLTLMDSIPIFFPMKLFKPAKEENELKQIPIKLVYLVFFIVQIA